MAALGLYFVIGAIAWTTFIYNGIPVPDSFATILATIAGGLAGGPSLRWATATTTRATRSLSQ